MTTNNLKDKEVLHELLGYQNIQIIQNEEMFSFSIDSMLLGAFANITPRIKKIIDLGCGNGPIPLYLSLKTKASIDGIEIQEDVYDMARRSVAMNGLENQINIMNEDLKGIYKIVGPNKYDLVTCNPPYFKYLETSNINKNDYLTIARHEVKATLEDIVQEAKRLLVDGGAFCMVHRAERLSEIIEVMNKNCFQIKRIRFVYPKFNASEALLVLIEGKKNSNPGLKVLAPLYIYDENGEYSLEVKECFNLKKE